MWGIISESNEAKTFAVHLRKTAACDSAVLERFQLLRFVRHKYDLCLCVCRTFVEEKLGVKYTEGRKVEFARSFRESGPASPVFFILSPGVDPLKDVESLGKAL